MEILKFEPLLKQTLWGGDKIAHFKHLDTSMQQVGESWELSGVEGSESVVAEGTHKGLTLSQLIGLQKEALVGRDNYERFGTRFPLLIKFIDAHKDLSIQVHPNDELARRRGLPCGKTEMWYVIDTLPGAGLFSGLSQPLTPQEYAQRVANDTICDVIARHEVHPGDVFFLPAGRIHSIGAGCFLAEIQQTSDVTYRIYDFKRRDKNGNLRHLHTHEAVEAIDYHVYDSYRTDYTPQKDAPLELVSCPHFTTALYDLSEPMTLDYADLDSFVVLIAVKGQAILTTENQSTTIQAGETVLLPATTCEIKVEGTITFLETYV